MLRSAVHLNEQLTAARQYLQSCIGQLQIISPQFRTQGGQTFITDTRLGLGLGSYGILFLMMFLLVILGMFLDWVGILLLAVPIFVPIVKSLTFDGLFGLPGPDASDVALWFGVLYIINMQMSFLSPPFPSDCLP